MDYDVSEDTPVFDVVSTLQGSMKVVLFLVCSRVKLDHFKFVYF